eukprot:6702434-Pyramimonas_sp.AAC.1
MALEKRNARIQEWFGEALTNEKVEGLSEGEAESEEEVASRISLDEGGCMGDDFDYDPWANEPNFGPASPAAQPLFVNQQQHEHT